jgi:hypothetical protein
MDKNLVLEILKRTVLVEHLALKKGTAGQFKLTLRNWYNADDLRGRLRQAFLDHGLGFAMEDTNDVSVQQIIFTVNERPLAISELMAAIADHAYAAMLWLNDEDSIAGITPRSYAGNEYQFSCNYEPAKYETWLDETLQNEFSRLLVVMEYGSVDYYRIPNQAHFEKDKLWIKNEVVNGRMIYSVDNFVFVIWGGRGKRPVNYGKLEASNQIVGLSDSYLRDGQLRRLMLWNKNGAILSKEYPVGDVIVLDKQSVPSESGVDLYTEKGRLVATLEVAEPVQMRFKAEYSEKDRAYVVRCYKGEISGDVLDVARSFEAFTKNANLINDVANQLMNYC